MYALSPSKGKSQNTAAGATVKVAEPHQDQTRCRAHLRRPTDCPGVVQHHRSSCGLCQLAPRSRLFLPTSTSLSSSVEWDPGTGEQGGPEPRRHSQRVVLASASFTNSSRVARAASHPWVLMEWPSHSSLACHRSARFLSVPVHPCSMPGVGAPGLSTSQTM